MSNKEDSQFFDTPSHTEGQTSSIGGIWPPERAYSERIKAFYNLRPITSDRSLCVLQQRYLRECQQLNGAKTTRIQFRALLGEEFLRFHSQDQFMQEYLEAVIPLERVDSTQQLIITYFGCNHHTRRSSPRDLATAASHYRYTRDVQSKTTSEIFARAKTNGFSVTILDKSQNPDQVVKQLSELYARFNWSTEDVVKLVNNPANILAVARDGDKIVSAGIAELARIPFPGSDIRLAEITEAATLHEYGNQGLYTAVSTLLLVELARRSDRNEIFHSRLDLVFGECNALSLGVLKAVRHQGRTFSADVCSEYGFPGRGMLHQQVPILGVPKETPYNDLLPAYLLPSQLYSRYLI